MALISLAVMAAGLPEKYRSLAAIRWALATLNSRTMFLEGDNAGVLMPFGDLHNHSPPPGPQLPDLGVQLHVNMPFQPPMLAKTSGFSCIKAQSGSPQGLTLTFLLHARNSTSFDQLHGIKFTVNRMWQDCQYGRSVS